MSLLEHQGRMNSFRKVQTSTIGPAQENETVAWPQQSRAPWSSLASTASDWETEKYKEFQWFFSFKDTEIATLKRRVLSSVQTFKVPIAMWIPTNWATSLALTGFNILHRAFVQLAISTQVFQPKYLEKVLIGSFSLSSSLVVCGWLEFGKLQGQKKGKPHTD